VPDSNDPIPRFTGGRSATWVLVLVLQWFKFRAAHTADLSRQLALWRGAVCMLSCYFCFAASFSTLNPHNGIHANPVNGLNASRCILRARREEKSTPIPHPASYPRLQLRKEYALSCLCQTLLRRFSHRWTNTEQQGAKQGASHHCSARGVVGHFGLTVGHTREQVWLP